MYTWKILSSNSVKGLAENKVIRDKYIAAENDSCLTSYLQNLVKKKKKQQSYDKTAKQGGFRDTKTAWRKVLIWYLKYVSKQAFPKSA